jgi:DNA-binding winged helix-turn-helix (wHTH) protein
VPAYLSRGTLEAVADGTVAQLGSPKQRALLAVLLLHPGELIPSERLIDALWPEDPPRTAGHSIQIYISELRKSLELIGSGEVIRTRPPGYMLEARPETIDAWQFERLVRDGLRMMDEGDANAGRRTLRAALALWRGPGPLGFRLRRGRAAPHPALERPDVLLGIPGPPLDDLADDRQPENPWLPRIKSRSDRQDPRCRVELSGRGSDRAFARPSRTRRRGQDRG